MGKVRRGPHLLEAFRAAEVGEAEQGVVAPPQVQTDRRPARGAAGPWELALGESPCLVVRASAGTLAAVLVAGLAVVVIVFLLGRVSGGPEDVGSGEATPTGEQAPAAEARAPTTESRRAALPAAVTAAQAPTGPARAPAAQVPVYTVQVAIYGSGHPNRAEDLKTFLLSKGIPDVEVVQVGNQYRVCVGRFPSADDEAAKLALKRVRELGPDLGSAYVNRLR